MPLDPSSPRSQVAWLARRAGWGAAAGGLDELTELGVEGVIDRLVDPDDNGIAPEPSPWEGFEYSDEQGSQREQGIAVLTAWVNHMIETDRPYENALAWFWHDHFAVSTAVVNYLPSMLRHLDLMRSSALGDFRELIREVTTDPAMLVFLDGRTSTGESPNENFGRELLELYTTGIGHYTEDDVRAAAVALTGWAAGPRTDWEPLFIPFRHDDTPQTFLGVDGVTGVDAVVDTAVDHPATPRFIASKMARHFLGNVSDGLVDSLAATFVDADLRIDALARAVLEAGVEGEGSDQVTAPVPWSIAVLKATTAELPDARLGLGLLRQMGQVPGNPPNVGGYPGASTWLASSSTAGRFTAANFIAESTPEDSPVRRAAADRDLDLLADLLLRPEGFSAATRDALASVPADAGRTPGAGVLAVALASPDLLIR